MVTVVTKTIGAGGGYDYATFTAAEADVANIATSAFGSTNLVANDGAIVFEAAAGTYSENLQVFASLTTDATRNVTFTFATGAEHGGSPSSGVILNLSGNTTWAIQNRVPFTAFRGLVALNENGAAGNYGLWVTSQGYGARVEDCIITVDGNFGVIVQPPSSPSTTASIPAAVIKNNVITLRNVYSSTALELRGNSSADTYTQAVNNTLICEGTALGIDVGQTGGASYTQSYELTNNLVLGLGAYKTYTQSAGGTLTLTGSNNFGNNTNPFPAAIQGSPYPITPTTSFSTPLGSGDYAVYMGATGALADVTGNDVWQQGVGPASNPAVPTTDINGVTRSGTSCNPGAFEADGFVAPTVLTRTIGSGKDYASFALAEAAVTSIGSGTDLTFYNEAIVFEADAGTYTSLTFNSTLTTDATRNVTYKPAAGSEHGGTPGAGVRLNGYTRIDDDFQSFIGIEFYVAAGVTAPCVEAVTDGSTFDRCLFTSEGERPAMRAGVVGPSGVAAPLVVKNSVLNASQVSPDTQAYAVQFNSAASGSSLEVINSTLVGHANQPAITINLAYDGSIKLLNCLSLGARSYAAFGGATLTLTGSNNFGGSTNPFPAAIQGSPYPITPTTSTSPGAGDWAIYDATTGALVLDSDNDVLLGGIGPASNSDVPTTDIAGNTRSGTTTDPGAFQVSPAGIGAVGIGTEEAFGSPTITASAPTVTANGIASAEAFGTLTVQTDAATVTANGIASAEAFGSPTVVAGVATVTAGPIASQEAFGTPEVQPGTATTAPPGIGSGVAFGVPSFLGQAGILPVQIFSAEAFGTPEVSLAGVLAPSGIASQEAFGTAALTAFSQVSPSGIASSEVFGQPALGAGPQFRLAFPLDPAVVDVMTHVDTPLTTLTGQDRPIPGMVHTVNYYAQHLGWSSDQTAANDEPSPYNGDKITVIVPPIRGDGATP